MSGMLARPAVALVTSSFRGDFERCRLLCESMDRHASGYTAHYLLVEERDRTLFQTLAGPRRHVIGERDLLPWWLGPVPDPVKRQRRLWLHPFGIPLRGWHVQQLRRIAFASCMGEEAMISCDSDVVFVRAFDASSVVSTDGRVRFYRREGAIDHVIAGLEADHRSWSRTAGRLVGIREPTETRVGYITTLVPWRRDTVRAMAARIEAVGGRSAMSLLAGTRALSECTIYGRFVDEVEGRADRHDSSARSLARVYWSGASMDEPALRAFLETLDEEEVAICLQSFTGTEPALIRSVALRA